MKFALQALNSPQVKSDITGKISQIASCCMCVQYHYFTLLRYSIEPLRKRDRHNLKGPFNLSCGGASSNFNMPHVMIYDFSG